MSPAISEPILVQLRDQFWIAYPDGRRIPIMSEDVSMYDHLCGVFSSSTVLSLEDLVKEGFNGPSDDGDYYPWD